MKRIWLPDGESCSVEWYSSDGRMAGVERITESFLPHDLTSPRRPGFARGGWDPEHDLPFDPLPVPRDEDE